MKKLLLYCLYFFFIYATISTLFHPLFLASGQKQSLLSPLPDFLTMLKNKEVSTLNLWLPSLADKINSGIAKPEITGRSALVYDLTTKKVLYEKNPTEKLPMASLTKIMTAIIALENPKKDNKYYVTNQDIVGEDSAGLTAGETYTLNDLMYAMILHSANDAAETFASNYSGGRDAFIKAMNEKAKALGLSNTNFTNPSGLEGDGQQYTTAYDLLVMTTYALNNFQEFRNVSSTFEYTIPYTKAHKEIYLENETNLLTSYPGVQGVKTGYTDEAGLCLVTYLNYGGHQIIGVILNSEDRRNEMIDLLDYSLKSLGITPPHHG